MQPNNPAGVPRDPRNVLVRLPAPPSLTREQFQELLETAGVKACGCEWIDDRPILLVDLQLPIAIEHLRDEQRKPEPAAGEPCPRCGGDGRCSCCSGACEYCAGEGTVEPEVRHTKQTLIDGYKKPWTAERQPDAAPAASKPAWRVGRKVPLNVYDGDTPMFQCHTPEQAARIVGLLNAGMSNAAQPDPPVGWQQDRIVTLENALRPFVEALKKYTEARMVVEVGPGPSGPHDFLRMSDYIEAQHAMIIGAEPAEDGPAPPMERRHE